MRADTGRIGADSRRTLVVDGWLLRQSGHGTASFARTLMSDLAASAWRDRVRVAVPRNGRTAAPSGLTSVPLSTRFAVDSVIGEAFWQNRLARHVQRRCPDDVLFAPAPFYATRAAFRSVVICHDLIPVRFPRYLGRYGYRRWIFERRIRWLANASCVVTDSRFTARRLAEFLGHELPTVTTVPLWTNLSDAPAPTAEERRAVRSAHRLPERYWLYVGGYDYRKNVEHLIQAYGLVARVPGCPPLVLVGSIPQDLRKPVCDVAGAIGRASIPAGKVVCPGFVDESHLPALYAGAELFVYPSLEEGFGLPPVEAMSCGCPAVVADGSSLPEVVTDAAYRFAVRDVSVLADMLRAAVAAPFPLNPAFDRSFFSRERGLRDYQRVFERVGVKA